MKFNLHSPVTTPISSMVEEVINKITSINCRIELARFLPRVTFEKELEKIDMSHWIIVIEKLDDILLSVYPNIPSLENPNVPTSTVDSTIAKHILSFLCRLLGNTTVDKRFFQANAHYNFLNAYDIDIAELAINVIFEATSPSTSVTINLESEGIEVPSNVAEDICDIFLGSGLFTSEYAIIDYLRGHEPTLEQENITVTIPPRSTQGNLMAPRDGAKMKINRASDQSKSAIKLSIPTTGACLNLLKNFDSNVNTIGGNSVTGCRKVLDDMSSQFDNNSTIYLPSLYILRAIDGLKDSIESRIRLVALRFKCLYILSTSRISMSRFQTYLNPSGSFMRDFLSLADISSETSASLPLNFRSVLSTNSLRCIVGILKCSYKRKSLWLNIGMDRNIGLNPRRGNKDDLPPTFENVGGSHEILWVSIGLAACATCGAKLIDYSSNYILENPGQSWDENMYDVLCYADLAFELFATCSHMNESYDIPIDIPLVGSIASLLHDTVGYVSTLLVSFASWQHESDTCSSRSKFENELFKLIGKAISCLDYTFSKLLNHSAMVECAITRYLSKVFEIYANNSIVNNKMSSHSKLFVVESCFSLSSKMISFETRRPMATPNDSSVQIFHQSCCHEIINEIFSHPICIFNSLWIQALTSIRTVISAEPVYIAQFLQSSFGTTLKSFLLKYSEDTDYFNCNNMSLSGIVYPLTRLIHSCCITAEGQKYVADSNAIAFIIYSFTSPGMLMPNSYGLSDDTMSKLSNTLLHLFRDCQSLRPKIKSSLQREIKKVCLEARSFRQNTPNDSSVRDDLKRTQVLQKLTYLCTLIEPVKQERMHSPDMIREVLNEDVITALIETFPCTLPPPRQFFAQLSLRHVPGYLPNYGNYACSRALSNVLKRAPALLPQFMLTSLFKSIDECLTNISLHKISLMTQKTLKDFTATADYSGRDDKIKNDESSQSEHGVMKKYVQFGAKAVDVHILGILDYIPHICLFDPILESDIDDSNLTLICKFLTSLLTLEWTIGQVTNAVKMVSKLQGASVIKNVKESIRRLFAFDRSAMMEVCRFASTKQFSKPLKSCNVTRGLTESFSSLDSSDNDVCVTRIPEVYKLRVVNTGGVLFREDCEIDSSRIVLLAGYGTICTATERKISTGGVIRYKTPHGWISEYRRDRDRDALVEILDLLPGPNAKAISPQDSIAEVMTLRESSSLVVARVLNAISQLSSNLSCMILHNENGRTRDNDRVFSQSSYMLASSLGKASKRYFTYAKYKISEEIKPQCLFVAEMSDSDNVDQTPEALLKQKKSQAMGKGKNRSMSFEENDRDTTDFSINTSTLCLYYGSVIKYMITNIIDGRNGYLNTFLFRYLHHYEVVESILGAFTFSLAVLKFSIQEVKSGEIGGDGRCALFSLQNIFQLLKYLVQVNTYTKSPITETMTGLHDEMGIFELQDVVFDTLSTVTHAILPIHTRNVMSYTPFPIEIKSFWLSVVSDLVSSMQTQLPPLTHKPVIAYNKHDSKSSSWNNFSRLRSTNPGNHAMEFDDSDLRNSASREILSGIEGNYSTQHISSATPAAFHLDENIATQVSQLGFPRNAVISVMNALQSNSIEAIMDRLLSEVVVPVANASLSQPDDSTNNSASRSQLLESLSQVVDEYILAAAEEDLDLLAALQLSLGEEEAKESDLGSFPGNFSTSQPTESTHDSMLPPETEPIPESSVTSQDVSVQISNTESAIIEGNFSGDGSGTETEHDASFNRNQPDFNDELTSGTLVSSEHDIDIHEDSTSQRMFEFSALSRKFYNGIVDSVILSCIHSDPMSIWEGSTLNSFAYQLTRYICHFQKIFSSKLHSSNIIWELFCHLADLVLKNELVTENNCCGVYQLLLQLMNHPQCKETIQSNLSENVANSLVDTICESMKTCLSNLTAKTGTNESSTQSSNLTWFSPGFLFLLKLFDMAIKRTKNKYLTSSTSEIETEPKSILFNFDHVISNLSSQKIMSTVTDFLTYASHFKVVIEPQLLQSLLLLLSELLSHQEYTIIFIDSNAFHSLLLLQRATEVPGGYFLTKNSMLECSLLLTKIVIHCMETENELKLSLISAVRTHFKNLGIKKLSLEEFLKVFAKQALKNVDIFLSTMQSTCKIMKSNQTIHVELIDQNEGVERIRQSKDRAVDIVNVLVGFLIEDHGCNRDGLFFDKSDLMNSLADSTLALTRTSSIVAKVELANSKFIDWVILKFLFVNVEDIGINPTPASTQLKSAFRLLLSLGSSRVCRKNVFDSLIRIFKQSMAILQSKKIVSNAEDEVAVCRCLGMGRMASLISAATRASSSTHDNASRSFRRPQAAQITYSIDAIQYLFFSGLPSILVEGLECAIKSDNSACPYTVNAIMEPLELFSRPQFYKIISSTIPQLVDTDSKSNSTLSQRNLVDFSGIDVAMLDRNGVRSESLGEYCDEDRLLTVTSNETNAGTTHSFDEAGQGTGEEHHSAFAPFAPDQTQNPGNDRTTEHFEGDEESEVNGLEDDDEDEYEEEEDIDGEGVVSMMLSESLGNFQRFQQIFHLTNEFDQLDLVDGIREHTLATPPEAQFVTRQLGGSASVHQSGIMEPSWIVRSESNTSVTNDINLATGLFPSDGFERNLSVQTASNVHPLLSFPQENTNIRSIPDNEDFQVRLHDVDSQSAARMFQVMSNHQASGTPSFPGTEFLEVMSRTQAVGAGQIDYTRSGVPRRLQSRANATSGQDSSETQTNTRYSTSLSFLTERLRAYFTENSVTEPNCVEHSQYVFNEDTSEAVDNSDLTVNANTTDNQMESNINEPTSSEGHRRTVENNSLDESPAVISSSAATDALLVHEAAISSAFVSDAICSLSTEAAPGSVTSVNYEASQEPVSSSAQINDDTSQEQLNYSIPNAQLNHESAVILANNYIENAVIVNSEIQLSSENLLSVQDPMVSEPVEMETTVQSVVVETQLRQYQCPEGYEEDVFYSLPEFMQQEICEQQGENSQHTRTLIETAGYDYDTIMALPEQFRQEILEQARQDQQPGNTSSVGVTGQANDGLLESDNAAFLLSLTPELRAEVLLTADSEFLASLPPDLIAESQQHREQAAANWQRRELASRHVGGRSIDGQTNNYHERENVADGLRHNSSRGRQNSAVKDSLYEKIGYFKLLVDLTDLKVFPIQIVTVLMILLVSENVSLNLRVIDMLLNNLCRYESLRHEIMHSICDRLFEQVITLSTQARFRIMSLLASLSFNPSVLLEMLRSLSPRKNKIYQFSCLMEQVLGSLATPHLSQSPSELLSIVAILETMTVPFLHYSADKEISITENQSQNVKNIVEGNEEFKFIKIPLVNFSKQSLRSLCEVLSFDICTKPIADIIIKIICRIANIEANAIALQEEILNMLEVLINESEERLKELNNNLNAIIPKSGLEKISDVNRSQPSSSIVSKLPIGPCGARQHEQALRSIKVLLLILDKSPPMPSTFHEIFINLWIILEKSLASLRFFFVDDDNGDADDSTNFQPKSPQSSLTSVLFRILPVIEAFFLFHSFEIMKPTKSGPNSSSNLLKDSQIEDDKKTSTPRSLEQGSAASIRLISQIVMPGQIYRKSEQYQSYNLSLVANDPGNQSQKLPVSLQRSISLQSSSNTNSDQPTTLLGSATLAFGSLTNSPPPSVQTLLYFVQSHKGLFNLLIRARPSLLDGSMACLIRTIQLRPYLSFENKRRYFYSQLKQIRPDSSRMTGPYLNLRRDRVFEDSFKQLQSKPAHDLYGRLRIAFQGEEGVDAGGLTREWYAVLSREIFNANYALFAPVSDGATFQPNPLSMINMNHLDYFKFVGRVIGKSICDCFLMDAHFTRSFYKHVIGMPVDYHDIEAIEPDYFKSLKQILVFPLETLGVELTFSAESLTFGKLQCVDLVPNGRNIPVTDENKTEYIRLIAHHKTTSAIKSQIEAFLSGFYDLVPSELISIFSPTELELLICGLPEVNIEDLRANTDYHQYRESDDMIIWFWEVLRGFTREEKALFLQFVTGTSKVPLEGFSQLQGMRGVQRFSIHKAHGESNFLPTAHTCFNQLDLPMYKSLHELNEKLLMAIKEGSEGFGFA